MQKYSVLMSIYYKENAEWLKIAIESMLNQTVPPDEILIIKDGKLTRKLDEVLNSYSEKYPSLFFIFGYEENKGLHHALRLGVQSCRNEYIARMDADDYSHPERIEKQLEMFNKNQELDVVGCLVDEFTDSVSNVVAHVKLPEQHGEIVKFAKQRCPIRHPALMYKRLSVLNAGNYRDYRAEGYSFFEGEDYDLIVRMIMNGSKVYNIPKVYVYMRADGLYERRGGKKFLKGLYNMKRNLRRMGFCSALDFAYSFGAQAVVCLMPGWMRELVYKKLLRNDTHEKMT